MDFDNFVHEWILASGKRCWVVGQYRDGRYYIPQRKDIRKLTGASQTFGPLDYAAPDGYSYTRRSAAVKKARELYYLGEEE